MLCIETKGLSSMIGYFDTVGRIVWGFRKEFRARDIEKQNYLWLQEIINTTPMQERVRNIGLTITGAERKYLISGYKVAKVKSS
jgi:hypothetical protein